jgi:hypothetical protein
MRLISTIQSVGEGETIAVPVGNRLLGPEKPNPFAILMNNPQLAAELRAAREKNDAEMAEKMAIAARELAAIPIIQAEYDVGYAEAKNALASLGVVDLSRANGILTNRQNNYQREMDSGLIGYADQFKAKIKSRNAGELQATKDWFNNLNNSARIASEGAYYKKISNAPAAASIPDSDPITPKIPAANAAPGTTAVSTTSAVASDSTPGKTSPLTFAAVGLVALKLLAII